MRGEKRGLGILLAAGIALAAAQEDFSLWQHHEDVTLNTSASGANVPGDVTGFPLLVRLNASNFGTAFSQAKAGGADVRFTKADNVTPLPHEIERWDAAGQSAVVWVRMDTVKGNSTTQTIRMHWGKVDAPDGSGGAAVFGTADGFRGVWHFNNSLADATVNGNHGANNGTTDTAGVIGRGRSFGDANDFRIEDTLTGQHIKLGNPPSLNISGVITMEAWARWRVANDGDRSLLVHVADGTSENRAETFLRPANVASGGLNGFRYEAGTHFGTTPAGGTTTNYMSGHVGGGTGDFDVWIRLVGVYTGSNWLVYYNGNGGSTAGNLSQANRGAVATNGAWFIGGHLRPANGGQAWSRWFSGDLDEVRISSVARSADWIRLDYENQRENSTTVQVGGGVAVRPGSRGPASGFAVRAVAGGASFALPESGNPARLTVLDARGRAVWSRTTAAGERTVVWRGVSSAGRPVPRGTYAVRLVDAGGTESVRRFVLMP